MENIKKGSIPPQAIEVEEIVLGTILIDKNVIDTIISDFSVNLFYAPKNSLIASSIIELSFKKFVLSPITHNNILSK